MIAPAKDNYKYSTSQLLTFMKDSYLDRTSRPIYALIYILPFLVIYEIGTIMINPEILTKSLHASQLRVVSFIWIQNMLELLGFTGRAVWIATPLVVVIILLALQITSKTKWKVKLGDLFPMTLECILLGIPLIVLSLIFNRTVTYQHHFTQPRTAQYRQTCVISDCTVAYVSAQQPRIRVDNKNGSSIENKPSLFTEIVTGIGAGIYEELIFRLVLICLLMFLFQDIAGAKKTHAIILSVLISAALFSAHHHFFFVNGSITIGEQFSAVRFAFRAIAGVYFAGLFAVRGFGITAGTHAFYDILAAVLNASMFGQL